MSIVALGVTTLTSQQVRMQQVVSQRSESEEIIRTISMYLEDPSFCTQNLITTPTAGKASVSALDKGIAIRSLNFKNSAGKTVTLYSTTSQVGLATNLTIPKMTLKAFRANRSLAAISANQMVGQLEVSFKTTAEVNNGLQDQTIPVLLDTEGGLLRGCQFQAAGAGTLRMTDCKVGQFVRGVTATGELECSDFPTSTCPDKTYVIGITALGRAICSAPPASPPPPPPPPPRVAKAQWVQRLPMSVPPRGGGVGVPRSMAGESHAAACGRRGMIPATPDYGLICQSGELRANGKDTPQTSGAASIRYMYETWGDYTHAATQGTPYGDYCYAMGQKHDSDPGDLTVAYLCKERP